MKISYPQHTIAPFGDIQQYPRFWSDLLHNSRKPDCQNFCSIIRSAIVRFRKKDVRYLSDFTRTRCPSSVWGCQPIGAWFLAFWGRWCKKEPLREKYYYVLVCLATYVHFDSILNLSDLMNKASSECNLMCSSFWCLQNRTQQKGLTQKMSKFCLIISHYLALHFYLPSPTILFYLLVPLSNNLTYFFFNSL